MPFPDDDELDEWPDDTPDLGTLWVTFEPSESMWLELPDGSIHEWWPGFGFTR